MEIQWHGRDGSGRFSFSATPSEYDGAPPVERLYLDRDMLLVNNDVLALSGFLAFAPYCSGPLTLPRSISPELVEALEDFAHPTWLHATNVEVEPKEAPKGDGFAFLSASLRTENALPNAWGLPRNSTISVIDASVWSGYLLSSEMVTVASNAKILADFSPPELRVLPYVGAAILYMESLRCSTLVVADSFDVGERAWRKLGRLLGACKYALLREGEARAIIQERMTALRAGAMQG